MELTSDHDLVDEPAALSAAGVPEAMGANLGASTHSGAASSSETVQTASHAESGRGALATFFAISTSSNSGAVFASASGQPDVGLSVAQFTCVRVLFYAGALNHAGLEVLREHVQQEHPELFIDQELLLTDRQQHYLEAQRRGRTHEQQVEVVSDFMAAHNLLGERGADAVVPAVPVMPVVDVGYDKQGPEMLWGSGGCLQDSRMASKPWDSV